MKLIMLDCLYELSFQKRNINQYIKRKIVKKMLKYKKKLGKNIIVIAYSILLKPQFLDTFNM